MENIIYLEIVHFVGLHFSIIFFYSIVIRHWLNHNINNFM
jgi:hypothetical protein